MPAVSSASGCVVEAGARVDDGRGRDRTAPQPMRETRPPPPDAQAGWIASYWHWSGMQYTWIPGHWENAPPGAS